MTTQHASEVKLGQRFEFGKNWARFLLELDDKRIAAAINSLQAMLEIDNLAGRTFLDAGCGSGLFSLAARRLGAKVFSFDFDPESVACVEELKRRYDSQDLQWTISTGSILDADYIESLGQYDIVYSWGVLHHTGAMWRALENASSVCKPGGLIFIAIYNDQGEVSRWWAKIKRLYNVLPRPGKFAIALGVGAFFSTRRIIVRAIVRASRLENPFATGIHKPERGMSWFSDVVDWAGGYPFEVARPDDIFDFFRARGFNLMRLKTVRGHACNEFVFRRVR